MSLCKHYLAIATAAALTFFSPAKAIADSSLPPSDPGAAIQLGELDRPVMLTGSGERFPCKRYSIKLFTDKPHFNVQYFKFSVGQDGSEILAKMQESPDATLWFHLLDQNLGFIAEFKGGNDQFARRDVARGTYYLRLMAGTDRKNPDGSNSAVIDIRALPKELMKLAAGPAQQVGNIGTSATNVNGDIGSYSERKIGAESQSPDGDCAMAATALTEQVNEIAGTAHAGRITAALKVIQDINWSRFGTMKFEYLEKGNIGEVWQPLTNSSFKHKGGAFRIRIGDTRSIIPETHDRYLRYTLSLSHRP